MSLRPRRVLRVLELSLAATALHCTGYDVTTLIDDPRSSPGAAAPTAPGDEPVAVVGPGGPAAEPVDDRADGDDEETATDGETIEVTRCSPRALGGPFWLTELETVTVPVECLEPLGKLAALEVRGLPPGAAFDPVAGNITFTPGLDQAGVYDLSLQTPGVDDVAHIELQVADRFDDPSNRPVDPETYTMEYGIPVLHLGVDSGLNRKEYTPASVVYNGHRFEGAEAKYRGRTSFGYPKRNYTLKFAKTDRFSDPSSAPGFINKRKITLTTTFDDNSYLRTRLAFQLWNSLDPANIQVQHFSVVVYLDGAFYGIYTLTDHVNRHLMEDNGYSEDGNLYKARAHSCNFRLTTSLGGPAKAALSEGYEKKEGTPAHGEPGAYDDLEELVRWVATAPRESFLAELDTRLSRSEYEGWWLLIGFIAAGDSAGKNSYHYRDPRPNAPDGVFHYVPWDFNDSFGQNWRSIRRKPEGTSPDYFTRLNMIFERLLTEPETREPLLARFRDVLDGVWSAESIVAQLDEWNAQIQQVAQRDEQRWGAAYASFFKGYRNNDLLSHEGEIDYMRQWIRDRHGFVRGVFLQAPLDMAAAAPSTSELDDLDPAAEGSLDLSPDGSLDLSPDE